MKLLLYTNTFIWWDSQPEKISSTAVKLLGDKNNIRLLSVASIWEIQIKLKIGKLNLRMSLPEIINTQVNDNKLTVLPISMNHVLALDELPLYHKDPFDRILMAQSKVENALLISKDPIFSRYSVNIQW